MHNKINNIMEKSSVELWAEALRSGEYKQGYGWLNYDNMYCCLGVAYEVYQKEVGGLKIDKLNNPICDIYSYDQQYLYLPQKVGDWLGLNSYKGKYNSMSSLDEDNDELKKTFLEMADIIESRPKGLFKDEKE